MIDGVNVSGKTFTIKMTTAPRMIRKPIIYNNDLQR
jgi:hypothetical protein